MEVFRCYYRQRGHRQSSLLRLAQLKRGGIVCFVTHSMLAQPLAIYGTTSLDIWPLRQHMACSHQTHIGENSLRFQLVFSFAEPTVLHLQSSEMEFRDDLTGLGLVSTL